MLLTQHAKINTLVVDDNADWQAILSRLIQMNSRLHLVDICGSAMEAYALMAQQEIDLLICDIEMPDMSGLDFVRSMRQPPLVIFVTAHADHALACYDVAPIDFLLKPIDPARFLSSIERVRQRWEHATEQTAIDPYFFIRESQHYVQIPYRDVLYVEAQENFLSIVTTTQTFMPILSLTRFLEQIKTEVFLRVHRSFLVNRTMISRIGKSELTLSSGHTIPIGDQYRAQFSRKHIEGNVISRHN